MHRKFPQLELARAQTTQVVGAAPDPSGTSQQNPVGYREFACTDSASQLRWVANKQYIYVYDYVHATPQDTTADDLPGEAPQPTSRPLGSKPNIEF